MSNKPTPKDHLTPEHVGNRLRKIRELVGVTQSELGHRMHIGQTALSHFEKRADMLVSSMLQYLEALGVAIRVDAKVSLEQQSAAKLDWAHPAQLSLPIIGTSDKVNRRDVVLSIKPEYSRKIVSGIKTIELRRRFPANVQPGTIALIYTTSPTRALTGLAEITEVLRQPTDVIWKKFGGKACIDRDDFDTYFAGTETGIAIKLRGARPLRRALELQELRERFQFEPPQSFLYAPPNLREALTHECSEVLN